MDSKVSSQSLVEKIIQRVRAALLGKATPIPVAVRTAPPVRVPVSRRRRVYP